MIKTSWIKNEDRKETCDHCRRTMSNLVKYEMSMEDGIFAKQWNKFALCEDCSQALGVLHRMTMERGNICKYDMDEYSEAHSIKEDN